MKALLVLPIFFSPWYVQITDQPLDCLSYFIGGWDVTGMADSAIISQYELTWNNQDKLILWKGYVPTKSGMIQYSQGQIFIHPHDRQIRSQIVYNNHNLVSEGVIKQVDSITFLRHSTGYFGNGDIKKWRESWGIQDDSTFIWKMDVLKGNEWVAFYPPARASRRH